MMRVIYTIFTIAIKNLKMHFSYANLSLRKNAICFEPLTQKKETNEKIADIIY